MFWFNGWTVYLMKGVSNMAIKKYIGARYAPKFMGAWDKTSEYAALSVVYTNEQSYVSRKTVPANTEITNTEFWIQSADWNAQVAQYNQNVERYEKEVLGYADTVNDLVGKTVYTYNTKDDMAADKRVKLNDTLMTCGYAEVNDKRGSFYKVVDKTSATAIALQNNLFAKPFTLSEDNISTPEQYGAIGDGMHDDTPAFEAALADGKELVLTPNKTYLVGPLDVSNAKVNGQMSTIKLKGNLNINSTDYYTVLQNLDIDCGDYKLLITLGRKVNILNCFFNNCNVSPITYINGYEVIVDNCHFTATDKCTEPGLDLRHGDSIFSNIVLIDFPIAIYNLNGYNIFSNIHAWILTPAKTVDSTFFKVDGSDNICTNIFDDTYETFITCENYHATVNVENYGSVVNAGLYTSTNTRYIYKTTIPNDTGKWISIENAKIGGSPSGVTHKLSNCGVFAGNINAVSRNFPMFEIQSSGFGQPGGIGELSVKLVRISDCMYQATGSCTLYTDQDVTIGQPTSLVHGEVISTLYDNDNNAVGTVTSNATHFATLHCPVSQSGKQVHFAFNFVVERSIL